MEDLKAKRRKVYYLGIDCCIYSRDPFEEIKYKTFTRKDLESGNDKNEVSMETEENKVLLKYLPASEIYLLKHSKLKESITGSFRQVKSKSRNLDLD
jgi:hypothetical protein